MSTQTYTVNAAWDEETRVWYVASTDIPGLVVEAETLEHFKDIVCDVAVDLLESRGTRVGDAAVPILVKTESMASARRVSA